MLNSLKYCLALCMLCSSVSCKTPEGAAPLQASSPNDHDGLDHIEKTSQGGKQSFAANFYKVMRAGEEAADTDNDAFGVIHDKKKVRLIYAKESVLCEDKDGGKFKCTFDLWAIKTGDNKFETKWAKPYGLAIKLANAIADSKNAGKKIEGDDKDWIECERNLEKGSRCFFRIN